MSDSLRKLATMLNTAILEGQFTVNVGGQNSQNVTKLIIPFLFKYRGRGLNLLKTRIKSSTNQTLKKNENTF